MLQKEDEIPKPSNNIVGYIPTHTLTPTPTKWNDNYMICQCLCELSTEPTPLEPNAIHSRLIIIVSQQTPSSKPAHTDLGMICASQWGRLFRDMTGPGRGRDRPGPQ
jgi:hypothetical protein